MRALFSGVTGIKTHQVRLDVIGNNIANVNTTGFKASRVTFGDLLNQTISYGSASTTPQQIGLGVGVASTDLLQGDGSLQMTGRSLDLAIEGGGFFIVRAANGQKLYTRAGNFDWDSQGYLVVPGTGQRVQGWMPGADGKIATRDPGALSDLQLVRGSVALAKPTTFVKMNGNLDAGAVDKTAANAADDYANTAFTAYDTLGNPHSVQVQFRKLDATSWEAYAITPTETTKEQLLGTLKFLPNGQQDIDPTKPSDIKNIELTADPADKITVSVDLSGITQSFASVGGSSILIQASDGHAMGTLENFAIDDTGEITGTYSNGDRLVLGQLGLASFANAGGLLKSGNNTYAASSSSGAPEVGSTKTGGRGRLLAGNLEMSNVDLATEFTTMILTQRGFQANTRIITTADQMLEDVVNLRR